MKAVAPTCKVGDRVWLIERQREDTEPGPREPWLGEVTEAKYSHIVGIVPVSDQGHAETWCGQDIYPDAKELYPTPEAARDAYIIALAAHIQSLFVDCLKKQTLLGLWVQAQRAGLPAYVATEQEAAALRAGIQRAHHIAAGRLPTTESE